MNPGMSAAVLGLIMALAVLAVRRRSRPWGHSSVWQAATGPGQIVDGPWRLGRPRRGPRGDALATRAAVQRWTYALQDDAWASAALSPLAAAAGRGHAYHVMVGRHRGHGVAAYEHSPRARADAEFAYGCTATYVLTLPRELPWVDIRPESAVDRLDPGLDIDLESEEFNRRFRVRAGDRRLATDLLTPRTMEDLLGTADLAVLVRGHHLIATTPGPLDADWITGFLDFLVTIRERIPARVWTDRSVAPPPVTGPGPA